MFVGAWYVEVIVEMGNQIPIMKHWIRLLIRQWCRSCLCFTLMCFVALYSLWLFGRHEDGESKSNFKKNANTVSEEKFLYVDYTKTNENYGDTLSQLTFLQTCPACLGKRFCNKMLTNEIHFQEVIKAQKIYSGSKELETWIEISSGENKKGKRLELGMSSLQNWLKFEDFVCRNASQPQHCRMSSAIHKTILAKKNYFSLQNLMNLHHVVDKLRSDLPLLVCTTEKLKKKLSEAFDEDKDGSLNEEEQLFLLTSLLVYPSYALMKLHSNSGLTLPFPKALGACGRLVFREADWAPLTESLNEPFEVRAGLALQVLQTIENFQDEDSEWYILNTEFSYDSLMVTKEGEVILTYLQDLALVDKSLFAPRLPNILDPDGDLCNEGCFQKFANEILQGGNVSSGMCTRIPHYGQIMYALACKQLLSDLDEHKTNRFFNFDANRVHKKPKHPGLLHSIPERDKESLEDLLRECVQETSSGGRKQAVEELREMLEKYLNYDDDDEDTANKDDSASQ